MSDLESFDGDSLSENGSNYKRGYKDENLNIDIDCSTNNSIVINKDDINIDNLIRYSHDESKIYDFEIIKCKSSNLNASNSHSLCREECTTTQSVPPLDLLSDGSSIIEATESCKRAFNIDLRAESMTSNSSEHAPEQTKKEIISTRWNQCSEKLQKCQLEKYKHNKSIKSLTCGLNDAYQYGEPIVLGEDVIGHELVPKNNLKAKLNFIASNKLNIHRGGVKSFSVTYGQLHKVKSQYHFGSAKCLTNSQYLFSPNLIITKRHRECFQSDPVLCSTKLLIDNNENYAHETQCNMNYMSKLTPSLVSPSSHTQMTPKINEPLLPIWPTYLNCLHTLRNGIDSPIKENDTPKPSESYGDIQQTYNSREKLTFYNLSNNTQIKCSRKDNNHNYYPTSASGVFRMGILQQAELAKAHKQFCHKHYLSAPTEPEIKTRLHALCSPNIKDNKSPQSRFRSGNCNSLTSVNCYQRKPLMPHLPLQQRYTFKDYHSLPSVNSKSRGLGPDIDNEQYRQRLARKLRQNDYAEHIRKCQGKSNAKVLCSENNIINLTVSHNANSSSSSDDKSCNKENEKRFEPDNNRCCSSNKILSTKDKLDEFSGDKSKEKHNTTGSPNHIASLSHKTFKNPINLDYKLSTRNSPEMSEVEIRKAKAAEKRLAMLNYAKHVKQVYSSHRRTNPDKQTQVVY
ncbi:cement precursor 3B variant 1 [Schistosoma japonicum]|nr:cement precursor 3B variant 1 [Schistosoma japonicum]KAH8853640.1 cement precursor 3B variant 1 [Schistosoma japonicum]